MEREHPNTGRLVNIERRVKEAYGVCAAGFCEAVAEACGESGNKYPSETAIHTALDALDPKGSITSLMRKRCGRCQNYYSCAFGEEVRDEAD